MAYAALIEDAPPEHSTEFGAQNANARRSYQLATAAAATTASTAAASATSAAAASASSAAHPTVGVFLTLHLMHVLAIKDIERPQGGVKNLNLLEIDCADITGGGDCRLGG